MLSQTEKTLYTGEKFTLGAEVQPQDAADKTVKWSSSDSKGCLSKQRGKGYCIISGPGSGDCQSQ